jgi:Carboxypeptidase regulatory-like domain
VTRVTRNRARPGTALRWTSMRRAAGSGGPHRLRVTADASQFDVPGDYSAELTFATDAPYVTAPTTVRLHVTAPAFWGEVSGTVSANGSGTALPGATVEICATNGVKSGQCTHPLYTTTTDAHGDYTLWVPSGRTPLDVVALAGGYTAQAKEVSVRPSRSTVTDFALSQS